MKPEQVMLIAGEASGDLLAARLVGALRQEFMMANLSYPRDPQPLRTGLAPRFFGAGGPRMQAAGVELAFDLTRHSVIGLTDALKDYLKFRRFFGQLLQLAIERQPEAIVCVDFSGFNRRFAHAVKLYARARRGWFHDWHPKLIQFVSPQVWASREGRAHQVARDYDLLLSIFPFEKEWYARRVPGLRVEFVGHPIVDRVHRVDGGGRGPEASPFLLLLPGSRLGEVKRHVPVMAGAVELMRQTLPGMRSRWVLPTEPLAEQAKALGAPTGTEIQVGGLPEALAEADAAIASTGTVTMECAGFGVPTVTLYKTSWSNYELARRIVKVKWLTMPNLLANGEVFPEFIQNAATPGNLARAALELLQDKTRRNTVKGRLAEIMASLGPPGAFRRAAAAIARCVRPPEALRLR